MLVPICAGLLGLPVIFRNVGETVFSLFLLSFGAINFAPSLDLGISRTAQRRVAFATAGHRDDQRALISLSLSRAAAIACLAGLAVALAGLLLFPAAGGASPLWLALITGLGVGVAIYANVQRGILEGLGAFSRSALNRAAVGSLLIGASLLASFFVQDAAALSLASLIVRLPFVWEQGRAIRQATQDCDHPAPPARHDARPGFMRESGWFALLSLLAVVMSGFDRYIFIGWGGLRGQDLATFLATQDMALRAIAIPAALLPVLQVRLAQAQDPANVRKLSKRLFVTLIPLVVFGCICIALISEQVAATLYPSLPRAEAAATIRVLLLGVASSAIAQFPMARLAASGRVRDATYMHLFEFALYLAVTPMVITRYGALGAAALWSGRIWLDAVLLIARSWLCSEHDAGRETAALVCSSAILVILWWWL